MTNAKEILRVSVTRYATRADAEEGLIDHLSGIQRADVKLIEEDLLLLGDLAVHIPGTPEAAICFVRGNVWFVLKTLAKNRPLSCVSSLAKLTKA